MTVGVTKTGNPKRVCIYGKTKAEVIEKKSELLVAKNKGLLIEPNQITVGEWLKRWLEDKQHSLEDSSIDSYERLMRLHLIPGLGEVKLTALRPIQLKAFYVEVAKKGLSIRTQQYIHGLLFSALKEAVRLELVLRNVAEVVRPEGKAQKKEIKTFNPVEAARFIEAGKEERLYPAYYLMLCLGLRRGETLGLHWEDIDFEEATVHIRQGLRKGKKGRPELAKPKTPKSKRLLHLPTDVAELLKEHKERQNQEREALGELWTEHGLVFPSKLGTPIHPDNFKRPFKRICDLAKIQTITIHGLRHSYTSLAINCGVDAKVVSEKLGHSDVSFTRRIYQHIDETQHQKAALSMKELLGKKAKKRKK